MVVLLGSRQSRNYALVNSLSDRSDDELQKTILYHTGGITIKCTYNSNDVVLRRKKFCLRNFAGMFIVYNQDKIPSFLIRNGIL